LVAPVPTRNIRDTRPLVLVGFMASGKSTTGALLADRLALPFVDTDQEIESLVGMSIADIFQSKGEPSFRRTERDTILALLEREQCVVAAGGGAFLDPMTQARLAERAYTIWLDPSFEIIRARLRDRVGRPLALSRTDEELHHLWMERRQSYSKAQVHIKILREDASAVVQQIVERLGLD
jgi:shikimate kinase